MFRSSNVIDTLWAYAHRGARPTDNSRERVRRAVMTMTAMIIGFLAIFWGLTYFWLGYPLAGSIPMSYSVITVFSIGVFFRTKHFGLFRLSQLLLILLLPFLLQWSLGGFSNGSIVMIWAFFTPLAVLLADGPRSGLRWLYAFLALALLSGVLDPYLAARVRPMPEIARTAFFLLNMAVGLLSVYAVLDYFVKDSRRFQAQLQRNEQRITQLMLTDPLTGAANRRRLDQWMEQAGRQAYPVSLVAADLDHFKSINDNYGHATGDRVLQHFCELARRCIREDDILARVGGEEFVIVLPRTPSVEAHRVAERIRSVLHKTDFAGVSGPVTASFGVSSVDDGKLERLLSRADQQLYISKTSGRNRVSAEAGALVAAES